MDEHPSADRNNELLERLASLPGMSATRRSFIKKAAAAGAIVYISPTLSSVFAKPAYASITGGEATPTPTATLTPPLPKEKPMYVQYFFTKEFSNGEGEGTTNTITVPAGKTLVAQFLNISLDGLLEMVRVYASFSGDESIVSIMNPSNATKGQEHDAKEVLFVLGMGDTLQFRINRGTGSGVNTTTVVLSGQLLSV